MTDFNDILAGLALIITPAACFILAHLIAAPM